MRSSLTAAAERAADGAGGAAEAERGGERLPAVLEAVEEVVGDGVGERVGLPHRPRRPVPVPPLQVAVEDLDAAATAPVPAVQPFRGGSGGGEVGPAVARKVEEVAAGGRRGEPRGHRERRRGRRESEKRERVCVYGPRGYGPLWAVISGHFSSNWNLHWPAGENGHLAHL